MSTLLRDAIARKMRGGMTIDNMRDIYGIDLRAIGKRPEPRRSGQPWTQDMVTSAASMWERGYTVSRIAAILGVSEKAMGTWAAKHRDVCPRRKGTTLWTDERRAVVVEMWREGKPVTEIAKTIGVSCRAARGWAERHRDLCPARLRKPKEQA